MSVELPELSVIGNGQYNDSSLVQVALTHVSFRTEFYMKDLVDKVPRLEQHNKTLRFILNSIPCVSELPRVHGRSKWVRIYDPRQYPDTAYPRGCGHCIYKNEDKGIKCAILSDHHTTQRHSV